MRGKAIIIQSDWFGPVHPLLQDSWHLWQSWYSVGSFVKLIIPLKKDIVSSHEIHISFLQFKQTVGQPTHSEIIGL